MARVREGAVAPARWAALEALSERRRRDARMRDLLRDAPALATLDERDRALASRLALGTVAARGELDRVIDARLSPGAHLEPRVRDALELACFELLYLSTPDAVAASQGVELVRGVAPRAAGLANAVLRRVGAEDVPALGASRARLAALGAEGVAPAAGAAAASTGAPAGAAAGPSGASDPAPEGLLSDLARVSAQPQWLCEAVLGRLGAAGAARWAARALEPPLATVAANRVRHTTEGARALLAEAGCEPEVGPLPGSLVLGRPSALTGSGLVERVDVLPCDLAAQEVVLAAAPAPGARVLEVGQGRGTKTVLLEGAAVAAGGPCEVVAVEVDARKSQLAAARMADAGVAAHVRCACADGRTLAEPGAAGLPEGAAGTFELVLVDAPCTGSGTLRRHPALAWSLRPGDVPDLAGLQLALLEAAASRVAPGGALVYATCSILPEEDEDVVARFLAGPRGGDFGRASGGLTSHGTDAHFWARLVRAAG